MQLRTLFALMASLVPGITAGDVFAHYMAGDIDASSAQTDVKAAAAMGFSAFAINLNADALSSNWYERCTDRLFQAAADHEFKCFISMDLDNADDKVRNRFKNYVNKYMAHPAYYKRDSRPLLSTFSVGRTSPRNWPGFLGELNNGNGVYFLPSPDSYEGYYAYGQPAGTKKFWDDWSSVVDGVFSWETAWTKDGKKNVSASDWDEPHAAEAHRRNLSYMVPMSSLQFKHWVTSDRHNVWYRDGEVVLPQRMAQVLAMNPRPDMAEVITWNDSGESHYIGTVHTDGQIPAFAEYANEGTYSHVAWQPLFRSFIKAFEAGESVRGMKPVEGQEYEGAMWYRSVTTNANCRDKPSGASNAKDALNWAVIVAPGKTNAYLQAYSGGVKIQNQIKLSPGLNYGSIPGLRTGKPYIEVVEISGDSWNYKYTKTGDVSVTSNTNGGICNYNYLVYGLESGRYN